MNTKLMRHHGKLFVGSGSVEIIYDLVKEYSHPVLILSPSAYKNPKLNNLKSFFSDIFLKESGEPKSEDIDAFVSKIQIKPDLIIAIGGGSLIDFAKVIAILINNPAMTAKQLYGLSNRNNAIDLIAVPTTAGTGTEVTGVSVVIDSESLLKYGILGDDIVPKYAILDPDLTLTLNLRYTVSTGVDALTHALEAFCSKYSFYMTDMYAYNAIKIIWSVLPNLVRELTNSHFREQMLYASMLAGLAFGTAGTGAVHGFAHIIGGKYSISHGEANSIFLAPVMWYNFRYNKNKIKRLFKDMGYKIESKDEFSEVIRNFLKSINAPVSFNDLNVKKPQVDEIWDLVPVQKRLFEKTKHCFTKEDVNRIIDSL